MKKKIVKPKSAVPDLDDTGILRAQLKKAEEMKRRQGEEEERRRKADEEAKVRREEEARAEAKAARDEERKKLEDERKKLEDDRKRREHSQARKLDDERRSLEEERRKIREEKERLERERALEVERRKLEEERRKLEEERKKLQAEPAGDPRKQTSKGKSSKRRAADDEDEGLDAIDPAEMDEILALSREQTGAKAKPSGAAKKATPLPAPKPPARRGTPSPEQGSSGASAKAKRATPVPSTAKSHTRPIKPPAAEPPPVAELVEDDAAQLLVTRPETAQDWIADIKTGIDWRKIGLTYGAPALLALVMMVFFGSAFMYGCADLPEKRAKSTLAVVPKPDTGLPPPAPTLESNQTWMPVGPIRLVVPLDGPILVDWERPSELRIPQATERIVVVFPGWKLELRRHQKTAITEWLKDTHCSTSFLEFYVTVGDSKMVDDVMESTPDDFEWFSGPSWVQRFRDKLNLKDQLFPEIKTGVCKVTYGGATGYYFGEPGRGDQRIELFDTTGHRLSYVFHPGGIKSSQTKLRNAQPSAPSYALPAKQAFEQHMEAYQKKDKGPEPYRELLCAAMYAAGLAMNDDLAATKIDDVRTALTGSQFTKLLREDDKEAQDAFDFLRGPTLGYLPELRRVLLGLYGHPDDKYQERARKYFEKLMGRILAPGDAGYRAAEAWVELEER